MATSLINRLLKMAAVLSALCVLAFSTPSFAGPELVKNGNFDNTVFSGHYPGELPIDWPGVYDIQTGGGASLTYCYKYPNGCGWGSDSVAYSQLSHSPYISYFNGWTSPIVLSQLINGLEIGRTYAVSYSSWGEYGSRDKIRDGGFWSVSLTDTQGRTQIQNGPREIQPPEPLHVQYVG